jgi:hypothetical protein
MTLLSFLCLTHLGVLVCFVAGLAVSPMVAPLALAGALLVGYGAARWQGLCGRMAWLPVVASLVLLFVSLAISASFLDMSWDGLWYHQTAIYRMEKGWNPIREPICDLPGHLRDFVLHYAKGSWYFATAIYETTGHIEWGKCGQWLVFAAMFLSVFAAGLELGMSKPRAGMLAALVSLSPVVTCQLYSYYVDGLMIAYLACFAAAFVSWMRQPRAFIAILGATAAIQCINIKFTGLVYLCFIMAGFGLYSLLFNRQRLLKYALVQAAPLLLGVFIWGYNPYVTNTIHRGNPFYPLYGSKEHPGMLQNGEDPIEKWETPENMKGRSRAVRFGYALFGRPVFHTRDNAELMIPFMATPRDMKLYYFHEQRIAGFGPFFSGVLVLGLLLLIPLFLQPGSGRWLVLLGLSTLIVSLSISKHAWWARYGPQMWWVPIIPIMAVFLRSGKGWLVRCAWVVSVLLLLNALLVAGVHARWEMASTRTLNQQMASLVGNGTYEFDFDWFGEPFSERLKAVGVSFRTHRGLNSNNAQPMLSVCPGYPGTVYYRRVAKTDAELAPTSHE